MLKTLSKLTFSPEKEGLDCFEECEITIDGNPVYRKSEMHSVERRFIDGLVRYYKPKSVLEIGVSAGGSSVVLLNALSGLEDYHLTCIDISDTWYRDKSKPVGFVLDEYFPSLVTSKRELITGKDPVEVLPGLGRKFDFVLIDSAHLHPVESLNFLTVLPFLNEGAIVVLHDTALHIATEGTIRCSASRILWSSIVGEKLETKEKYEAPCYYGDSGVVVANIGAIQINADTRKHVRNVFDSLLLYWEMILPDLDKYYDFIKIHYGSQCLELLVNAERLYKTWYISGFTAFSCNNFIKAVNLWEGKPLIFYGAGNRMRELISMYNHAKIPFNYPIWDVNASTIKEIHDIPITEPCFSIPKEKHPIIVCTIANKIEFNNVRDSFENLGYDVLSLEKFLGC